MDSLLNDHGNAYSTIALTWGRKPGGGFNWTDAAWSSACIKCKNLRPTSIFTLRLWTGPLARSTLPVAGIVAGAPGCPKLSYASERTTVVNWTPPESSGGGRGYHSPQRPWRAATGGFLVDEDGICT